MLIRKDWNQYRHFRFKSWKIIDYISYVIPGPLRRAIADMIMKIAWPDPQSCRMVGTIDGARFQAKYPAEWWQKTVKGTFEGRQYDMPEEYDKVLRRMYGDYMQMPPEERRTQHQTGNVIFSTEQEAHEIRRERKK